MHSVTCTCPPNIYTNYLLNPPYTEIVGERLDATLVGIFPQFLKMIIGAVCTGCRSYQKSDILYDQTLTGHPSQKIRTTDLKNQIVGSHLTFPLFGSFNIELFQGQHPYVGIVESQGSALITPLLKVKTLGFMAILRSIKNAWSVMLVAVLIASIVGWLFWFFVSQTLLFHKGGSRHKVYHYEKRIIFFIRNFSSWSTFHRNALAAWAISALYFIHASSFLFILLCTNYFNQACCNIRYFIYHISFFSLALLTLYNNSFNSQKLNVIDKIFFCSCNFSFGFHFAGTIIRRIRNKSWTEYHWFLARLVACLCYYDNRRVSPNFRVLLFPFLGSLHF